MVVLPVCNSGVEIFHIVSFKRTVVVNPYDRHFHLIKKILLDNSKVKDKDFVRTVFVHLSNKRSSQLWRCLDNYSLSLFFIAVKLQKGAQSVLVIVKKEQRLFAIIQIISYLSNLSF